ncbi:MAG: DUF2628 domain-containing protein [Hydrogenovibrio sp.]|nr:DUF2628 domain-containing protein [Hydrogenovibrio sp.]
MSETPENEALEAEKTASEVPSEEAAPSEQELYETRLMEAFIQKPSKMEYYQAAYDKMTATGTPNLKWHWSWWGFFGGWAFLLYRKAYLPALVTFIVSTILSFLPFGGIATMIVLGGITPYFVIKRYANLKIQVENRYEDPEKRIDAMREVGGFHTWVAWAGLIYYAFVILMLLTFAFNGAMTHY